MNTILSGQLGRRLLTLALVALAAALLIVDYGSDAVSDIEVNTIVDQDIRAPFSFSYIDERATSERAEAAASTVRPVFAHNATVFLNQKSRIQSAFQAARSQKTVLEGEQLDGDSQSAPRDVFSIALGVSLTEDILNRLENVGWSTESEALTIRLLEKAMDNFVIASRSELPPLTQSYDVITIYSETRSESTVDDLQRIKAPEEVRQQIAFLAADLETTANAEALRIAAALSKACVRINFGYDQLLTENRRLDRRNATVDVVIYVQRGKTIVRAGEPVTAEQVAILKTFQQRISQGPSLLGTVVALLAMSALLIISLYVFGAGFVRKFSTRSRDLEAMAVLGILTLGIGRLIVEAAPALSGVIGQGMAPQAFWYLTPLAGGAMLIRILINSETALFWTIVIACLMACIMGFEASMVIYFVISGVTATAGMSHTRERVHVLRSGLQTGFINAAVALTIQLVVAATDSGLDGSMASHQPLWDAGMAVLGGIGSAIMVLGLVPLFEQFGFVTDYKMLELANLDHPLLRQLMLRAPGTYHHSMTMALLSEAAAESIGANALHARVACYYHDIGKSLHPQNFIENQRDGVNPHDSLQPHQSARRIQAHVEQGIALGQDAGLPQPVMDAIETHHGTSLIKYFYVKAVEQAVDGELVDEIDFRYNGRRPNTRESGIIFLADRVEAACRTLKNPSAEDYRAKIQELVNGALLEGQLEDCPLTLKEIYTIIDSFVETLLSINHHRIEYPKMPTDKNSGQSISPSVVITLEQPNPLRPQE